MVNNIFKRVVQLIPEINKLLTNYEADKLFLLKIVEINRKHINTETTIKL